MSELQKMERILWFDQQIRAERLPNARTMAEQFEISTKTAQRTINFIRDRLHAPLVYDSQRRGFSYRDADFVLSVARFNMHFGYRVINEVCRFARLARSHVAPFDPITVLDIQLVQKILPKFHGTQARLEEPLKRMQDFAQADAGKDQTEQIRLPRTSRKVSAMLRTLSVQGYADFIERCCENRKDCS